MFAGKGGHLRRLCLSYFFLVSPALGNSFIMNAEHETPCTFDIHVEELFDNVPRQSPLECSRRLRATHSKSSGHLLSPRWLWHGRFREWQFMWGVKAPLATINF
jgi:hypothetical protein